LHSKLDKRQKYGIFNKNQSSLTPSNDIEWGIKRQNQVKVIKRIDIVGKGGLP